MPEVMPEVKEKTKKLAQPPAGKKQMPATGTSTGPAAGKLEARKAMEDARFKRTSAKRQQIAERLAAAIAEIASGTEEAAKTGEETLKIVEGTAQGTQEVGQRAAGVLKVVQGVEKAARDGAQVVSQAAERIAGVQRMIADTAKETDSFIEGVRAVANQNATSARDTAALQKQAEEIRNIVQTVLGIADPSICL